MPRKTAKSWTTKGSRFEYTYYNQSIYADIIFVIVERALEEDGVVPVEQHESDRDRLVTVRPHIHRHSPVSQ